MIIIFAIIVLSSIIGLATSRLLIYKFHDLNDSNIELKRPWIKKVLILENSKISEIKRFTFKGAIESHTVESQNGNFNIPKTINASEIEKMVVNNNIKLTEIDLFHGGIKVINEPK